MQCPGTNVTHVAVVAKWCCSWRFTLRGIIGRRGVEIKLVEFNNSGMNTCLFYTVGYCGLFAVRIVR